MLEKDYENAANKILSKEGWLIEKVKFHNAGYPDRIYIHVTGVLVWLEWKRNDTQTEPYPLQRVRILELVRREQYAAWTDDTNAGVRFCRSALVSEGVPSGRYQNAVGTRGSSFVPGPWPWEDVPRLSSTEDPQSSYVNQ